MAKVLSANYMRLKKDKIFWIGFVFMFAAGIFFPAMRYMDMKQTGTIHPIDHGFWGCALFIGILMAVFCSLFIGTEYSDGTIRNKVIVGQNRNAIYLANFIICAAVSLILCIAFFVPYLCIGIPLLGFFHMPTNMVLLFVLTAFLLAVAFSSIFTLISMLNPNKAITAVICILFAFLLLFTGAQLNKMLSEPETNMALVMGENGQEYEEIPNPHYLNEATRKTVQFFYDFVPGGQVIQCMSLEAANLPSLPLYSFLIILSTTGIGLFCFQKKDLK
ncbi:MAG: ABC transporter permease subunit [Lachnospiraceae bacterium]|nr:ABC transporter permease subunit [Lachnospiraceae bacterium]